MPSADNGVWDRGHPSQPGDNAGAIARQTVCKWRSHRERNFFVLNDRRYGLIELFEMSYAKVEIPWETVSQLSKISDNEPHLQKLIKRLEQ